MQTYFIELSYLLASVLFILGLKGLSHSINQAHPYRSILAKNAD